jgi:stage V sporulation protein G
MEITEIRVFLKESPDKKLKAYTTVTFDNVFVVRNIKVIQGAGGLFIAMPSRKIKTVCPKCNFKNEVGSRFCSYCGVALSAHHQEEAVPRDAKAEHRDIAHPVTQQFRDYLQGKILDAYKAELEKAPSLRQTDNAEEQF